MIRQFALSNTLTLRTRSSVQRREKMPSPVQPNQETFHVRPLQLSDIVRVRKLHCATLPVQYSPHFFSQMLSKAPGALVATLPMTNSPEVSGEPDIIGCISAEIQSAACPTVHIGTLCVDPTFRRHGVARLLLDRLILSIKAAASAAAPAAAPPFAPHRLLFYLHVQAANRVAHRFYLRAGFRNETFVPGYYLTAKVTEPLDPALQRIDTDDDGELQAGGPISEKDAWFMVLETGF